MTVGDLMEMLSEFEPGLKVKVVYQPRWPMAENADFVKDAIGTNYYGKKERALYICASASGGNEYAPGCLYDDEDDEEDEEL